MAILAEKPETMELERIIFRSCADRGWDEALAIYERSFPRCERRSAEAYDAALADERFSAEGIRLDGRIVGILFHWRGEGFRYVEYLAFAPEMRGRSLGSQVLTEFCDREPTPVVLEIEPPEEETAIRRLEFYRRLGFSENPYPYVHPSYSRPFEPHRLVLLSRPRPLGNDEARRMADFVREHVLRYSEHDGAPGPRL